MKQQTEKVKVKRVENTNSQKNIPKEKKITNNILLPFGAALMLDCLDLATIGPVGIYFGLLIGFAIGWWIASIYKIKGKAKLIMSTLAGIYCMVPGTAFFPIATIISAISRFSKKTKH